LNQFALAYDLVERERPELGRVAVVPWDSMYFSFNVGTYEPADSSRPPSPRDGIGDKLRRWMGDRKVELLACTIPSDSRSWVGCLCDAGFAFVDLSLLAFARRLTALPPPRIPVRLAEEQDAAELVRIAGTAFSFGRYHADARFPRALANLRYQHWMSNAMAARGDHEFVFVSGVPGAPTGFVHAVIRNEVADLRLAAVDPARNDGLLGMSLFTGVLHSLVAYGARRAQARVSAANIPILNLYCALGFGFVRPESIFHLHAGSGLQPADLGINTF